MAPTDPGDGREPPPPPTNPDPPPMSARDLDAVLARCGAQFTDLPSEAIERVRWWLATLPPTAML